MMLTGNRRMIIRMIVWIEEHSSCKNKKDEGKTTLRKTSSED